MQSSSAVRMPGTRPRASRPVLAPATSSSTMRSKGVAGSGMRSGVAAREAARSTKARQRGARASTALFLRTGAPGSAGFPGMSARISPAFYTKA